MMLLAVLAPETARNLLLVIVGGCYLGYHLYHGWRWWSGKRKDAVCDKKVEGQRSEVKSQTEGQRSEVKGQTGEDPGKGRLCLTSNFGPQTSTPAPGEELYAQARAIPHRKIPDRIYDGEYLNLLAQSAELGYPMALAKLGEYARRRECNVEAYYWLWRAKHAGMKNLDRTLLQVRSAWAHGGFRREGMNEHEDFSHKQGTIGYALLCIDARYNADAAKARLAECAPEFCDRGHCAIPRLQV